MYQFKHSKEVNLAIPDNPKESLKNTIKVNRTGELEKIEVEVDIAHPYSGDLKISLIAPDGKIVDLQNRKGGPTPFKQTKYSGEAFKSIIGTQMKGTWTLQVADFAPRDAGSVKSWSISMAGARKEASVGEVLVDIPDNDKNGLVSQCKFEDAGSIEDLKVSLDINHGYVGDLTASLIAPSGKTSVLHQRAGGNQKNLKTTFSGQVTNAFKGESLKGIWKLKVVDHQLRDAGTLKAWGMHVTIGDGAQDDLTKIEGIGPKIQDLFRAAGINSFLQLSQTSVKKMKDILTAAGPRFQTHQPDTWARQAGLAALGDWTTLKKWQDELDGGK